MSDTAYYELLGVHRDSTIREVKDAYRRLARSHHPDKVGDAMEERFKRMTTAHEVLTDPVKRTLYELYGPTLKPGAGDKVGAGIAAIVPVFAGVVVGFVPVALMALGALSIPAGLLIGALLFFGARGPAAAKGESLQSMFHHSAAVGSSLALLLCVVLPFLLVGSWGDS